MSEKNWDRVPIDTQSIDAPLSRAAVFLVVTVASERTALAKVFSALDGVGDLIKTVGFRDLSARLSCIVEIGRELWDRLNFAKRPRELRSFAPIEGAVHVAPSTPGDLLFHIRSERPDLCFEFERILLDSLGTGVTVVDEISGFRYFDARDLLGFGWSRGRFYPSTRLRRCGAPSTRLSKAKRLPFQPTKPGACSTPSTPAITRAFEIGPSLV